MTHGSITNTDVFTHYSVVYYSFLLGGASLIFEALLLLLWVVVGQGSASIEPQ